mmetsp:Transcript_10779/g.15879  ORF Transcript_10779/g.15879 Transcript_10779/m.15879 type:complete len:1171 (+) Transcript_10779:126-3638(+)|eukprot:CAMPEP_0194203396 /NCGR_PEP_ID=MMETSP0156-20130528/3191_1 /TAXON_ID=33649 /ORGANISM="Thalassionema nitzschioides, Strain L26-B" /LENGTH=1170 /DNA_ID=CAMNT_0038929143 /DNA_START=126 /DNA_END=3638 /DNA_ORIENTATION=-
MASLPPNLDFPKMEESICEKWEREESFKTQDKLSIERGDEEFTFYDGPPFATGLPHYGHILAGTIKDTVTRYAAMNGKTVSRRAGWDCHGLPVEYEIDKKLNITHREQVLEMGIDKYNETCRGIVTRYTKEWEKTVTRLGRWIDFKNDYKTMDPSFMESVWWVFKQLYEKDLVYQGYKVMPYSTGCMTPLSNFEAGLNYKDVRDPAIVVNFPLVDDENVALIAWTTTPWTLPSNLALCVHPEFEYVKILEKGTSKLYILAKARLPQLFPIMNNKKKWKPAKAAELYEIQETFLGKDLVGKRYRPIFNFFTETPQSKEYFRVVSDTYVTDDAGTGIVHQAPAFGEDDYRVCLANGIITKGDDIPCPIDDNGWFTDAVEPVKGVHVKEADETLIKILKDNGRLVQKDNLDHSYPFCWRSDTPLIYKAVPSWFIRVEDFRDKIVENNKKTYWVPNNVKEVRFHNWLTDARDWAVSRNRFWGTPIPIWANEDLSEVVCIGSVDELAELSGTRVDDLHRETIDKLTIPSKKNPGSVLKRVDEVFDCWFESGSMPYAQLHYPFENKERFENGYPADFIAEGLDQTRGWFYTLMVLSTALFDKPAFKNLIVNGLVLAEDGKKMSKRLKNYPDPNKVIDRYGADALRMYLINSPVVRAESLRFQEPGVLGVVKEVFLPWYNAFRFFLQNVERLEERGSKFIPSKEKVCGTSNPTDVWISAATQGLIKFVHEEMAAYRLYTVMPALVGYVTQLTNWYVRLNRDRLKGMEGEGEEAEKEAEVGLQVLYDVLLDVTILMGPFTPFITEYFYQELRKYQPSYADATNGGGKSNPPIPGKSDSVHFLKLPAYDESRLNQDAVEAMEALQSIVEQGRIVRERRNISLRTPIKNVVAIVRNPTDNVVNGITGSLKNYILSELNAWDFTVVPKAEEHAWVTLSLTPNFTVLGKKLGKKMKACQAAVKALTHDDAVKVMAEGKLVLDDLEIDACDLVPRLAFSKEGDHWEAAETLDGSLVVGVDCTQDDSILSAGKARELMNAIQQLRKSAGLDLKDVVEMFFDEEGTEVEQAVAKNLATFTTKFKGAVPLPKAYAPSWAVTLQSEAAEVGGSRVEVSICRPCLSAKDGLDDGVLSVLSSLDIDSIKSDGSLKCNVDGKEFLLTEGFDYWMSAVAKAKATRALEWLL